MADEKTKARAGRRCSLCLKTGHRADKCQSKSAPARQTSESSALLALVREKLHTAENELRVKQAAVAALQELENEFAGVAAVARTL